MLSQSGMIPRRLKRTRQSVSSRFPSVQRPNPGYVRRDLQTSAAITVATVATNTVITSNVRGSSCICMEAGEARPSLRKLTCRSREEVSDAWLAVSAITASTGGEFLPPRSYSAGAWISRACCVPHCGSEAEILANHRSLRAGHPQREEQARAP